MKTNTYIILTCLFIFFVGINSSFCQQIDPKIQEIFGDKTQEILQNDPERIKK